MRRTKPPSSSFPSRTSKTSSALSVITDDILNKITQSPNRLVQSLISKRIWGVLAKGLSLDEVVYRLFSHFEKDGKLVICILDIDSIHAIYYTLKLLAGATCVTSKMTPAQVKSNLKNLNCLKLLFVDTVSSIRLRELINRPIKVVCLIYGSPTLQPSSSLLDYFSSAEHLVVRSEIAKLLDYPQRLPPIKNNTVNQKLNARIVLSRKIAQLTNSSSDVEIIKAGDYKTVSTQISSLRNRLKVLLSEEIVCPRWNLQSRMFELLPQPCGSLLKSLRNDQDKVAKMILLGMISSNSKHTCTHVGAEAGRTLACSRWMDMAEGTEFSCPWGVFRYGASCDSLSKDVCVIINQMKEYKIKHLSRLNSRNNAKLSRDIDVFATLSSIQNTVPEKVVKTLKRCRIVGFSWEPNPAGDDEAWGGRYGKACGHNEIVMFFARPFAPIEIMNTHLCSKCSPAPGNRGYDGCLEFLIQQCAWFRRDMHIWDDSYFHFISSEGKHRMQNKGDLLKYSLRKLEFIISDLRFRIINSDENKRDVMSIIDSIEFCIELSVGKIKLHPLFSSRINEAIGSFLLSGKSSQWYSATSC